MNNPFDGYDSGPQFTVTEAVREAVPALIALWGFSDSGKTYSALRLARGLVGPSGTIVVIDTENKRAKLYAGLFGGFKHIDMQPPFTPARYQAAFSAAIQAGADVVVVDSQSHVWEGEGGVLEQADASNAKGLLKWKNPKMAYKRMTNAMFRAPIHMIFCLRAKEKFVQEGQGNNASIVSAGHVPICDSRFIFEMTVSCHMDSGSRKPLGPVKAPDPIAGVIRPGEYITEEHGRQIAEWLAGGVSVDHQAEALQNEARQQAGGGYDAYVEWWRGLKQDQKKSLKSIEGELKFLCDEADAEIAQTIADANDEEDPLNDPFTERAA